MIGFNVRQYKAGPLKVLFLEGPNFAVLFFWYFADSENDLFDYSHKYGLLG